MATTAKARAAVQATAEGTDPGTAVAKAEPAVITGIRSMEDQFRLAMPRGAEAAQLVRDAITCVRTIRNLDRCRPDTVYGALMTMAQLGLRPGVLGHGWPLPFWDGRDKCYKAQLVIGYQGLVELAYRSGRIVSIAARTVHVNDHFELGYGAETDVFAHRPRLDGPRGEPRLYYAIARIVGGGYAFADPMTQADMEAHRDRYAPKNKAGEVVGPWRDQFEGMAQKTMIRRLSKLLPKSTDLARALEVDSSVRVDLTPDGIDQVDHPDYAADEARTITVERVDGHQVDTTTGEVIDDPGPSNVDLAAMNAEAEAAEADWLAGQPDSEAAS